MPVVFRYNGVRFYFYSNEGSPREPVHIHAERGEAEAKFWLRPEVSVADSRGSIGERSRNWFAWLRKTGT